MIPQKKTNMQHNRAQGPLQDRQAPTICTGFPPSRRHYRREQLNELLTYLLHEAQSFLRN